MLKFTEKTVEILRKVAEKKLQEVSPMEQSYLKIELIRLRSEELDVIEDYIYGYITQILHPQVLRPKFFNALEGALFLLEDVREFSSCGRQLYTIKALDSHKKTVETINSVYHMLLYVAEFDDDIDFLDNHLISSLFYPKALEYVKYIIKELL